MMERPYSSAYENEVIIPQELEAEVAVHKEKGFFQNIDTDDIILIAVILLLLNDGKCDKGSIAILAFLLISGGNLF